MGTGLLVTSLIGASINPTTGDYSRGASGFWVENGAIVRPVNECTIAGNLRAMLRDDPAGQRRPAAPVAGGAEPARRGPGHCRSLTSRCSRPRRRRGAARSRSRQVGDAGRGAREARRPRPGQRGRPRGRPACCARAAARGAARLRLAVRGERGRPGAARRRAGVHRRPDRRHPRLPRRASRPGRCRWPSSRPGGSVAGVVHLPALGRTYAAAAAAGRAAERRADRRQRPRRARRRRGCWPTPASWTPALWPGGVPRGRAAFPPLARLPALPGRRGPLRRHAHLPRHLGVGRGGGRPDRPRGRRAWSPTRGGRPCRPTTAPGRCSPG